MSAQPEHAGGELDAYHRDGTPNPLVPQTCRVLENKREASDVVTLVLDAPARPLLWHPGQFNMLTAYGIGEVAISISNPPGEHSTIVHTVRDVGAVTHALCSAQAGSLVGVRGAFGIGWGVDNVGDADVIVVAGGIGLAPLRGAIEVLIDRLTRGGGRLFIAVGARQPDQLIFGNDLSRWRLAGAAVEVIVDVAAPGWNGHVGLVTDRLAALAFDPAQSIAMVCGPEIMMRFVARDLSQRGVSPSDIRVSLERNMQCGVAFCGHCQLGPLLLCRDGPVVNYESVAELMSERER
jgi:NAD(P)H-flavin reductase